MMMKMKQNEQRENGFRYQPKEDIKLRTPRQDYKIPTFEEIGNVPAFEDIEKGYYINDKMMKDQAKQEQIAQKLSSISDADLQKFITEKGSRTSSEDEYFS